MPITTNFSQAVAMHLSAFCCVCLSAFASAQTGLAGPATTSADAKVAAFMKTYNVPGMQVAIAKDGKLVYTRAFGSADLAGTEPMQPYHRQRIASVSKPITGIAAMKLVEAGKLDLNAKVFGPQGLLATDATFGSDGFADRRIYDITVRMLLEHRGGWDRGVSCFPNPTAPYAFRAGGCDPIDVPLYVTAQIGAPNPMQRRDAIAFLLEKGLDFAPDAKYAYSNIGFLVVAEVIEAASGMSYDAYVRTQVGATAGAHDMALGRDLLAERLPREVEYKGNGYMGLAADGSGAAVPYTYGAITVEAMDAHGGWVMSAADLVRVVLSVDGYPSKPDQLSATSIRTMTTPNSPTDKFYAKGWSVNSANNWWHLGSLPGTSSAVVRTGDGYVWAVIANYRDLGNDYFAALDNLVWNCRRDVSNWGSADYSLQPAETVAQLDLIRRTGATASLRAEASPTSSVIIVASEGSTASDYPLDGTAYTLGQELSARGSRVVYVGPGGANVSVAGLPTADRVYLRAFAYDSPAAAGGVPLYRLADGAELWLDGVSGASDLRLNAALRVGPSPAIDRLVVNLDIPNGDFVYRVVDVLGRVSFGGSLTAGRTELNVASLPTGMYQLVLEDHGEVVGRKSFVKG